MAAAGVNWVVDQTADEGRQGAARGGAALRRARLDVNAINSMGLTAAHGAANRGSDDIIRFLVSKGARSTSRTRKGARR
jgi:ankyrin repeat protein